MDWLLVMSADCQFCMFACLVIQLMGRGGLTLPKSPRSRPFRPQVSDFQHTQLQRRSAATALAADYRYLVGINEWQQFSCWYQKLGFLESVCKVYVASVYGMFWQPNYFVYLLLCIVCCVARQVEFYMSYVTTKIAMFFERDGALCGVCVRACLLCSN